MVEFGLKLRDNRVEEWSDYYIRYEKLKQILKRYKAQWKNFNDLAKKDEEVAKNLKIAWKDGSYIATPQASSENLTKLQSASTKSEAATGESGNGMPADNKSPTILHAVSSSDVVVKEEVSEKSLLLRDQTGQDKNASYGSQRSISSSPLGAAILRATSGVTDYFKYPLERKLKDALKPLDKSSVEFEATLREDIEMVNRFYNEKLHELQERVRFLKETVASSSAAQMGKTSNPSRPPLPNRSRTPSEAESVASIVTEGTADHPTTVYDEEETQLEQDISTPLLPQQHRRTASPLDLAKSFVKFSRSAVRRSTQFVPPKPHSNSERNMSLAMLDPFEDDDHEEDEGNGNNMVDRIREAESIQRAIVDLYRTAKLLQNYAIMNYTGFVKIVKKHDKTNPDDKGKFKSLIQPSNICNEGKAVEALAQRLEHYYSIWFCNGNRREARAQMLPKRGDGLEMDWGQLRLGYRMGMCTILGLWICWDCIWGVYAEHSTTIGEREAFPVFRACGGLLTLQWFWGMSTWVWSRYRINYIYLFDFDPRIVSSPLSIFNSAVDNTLVFLICMLLYYKAGAHDIPGDEIPAGIFPFLLVIYTFVQMVLPLRTRGPMWMSIWRLITAPLTSPSFYHGYVGDIFTSMVKVFQDMAWTVCFVLTGDFLIPEDSPVSGKFHWAKSFGYKHVAIPLLTLLPLWFRFNQCLRRYADTGDRFPHLANAFKYALSQTVTLFGAFHPLYMDLSRNQESSLFQMFWMFAFIGSSLYSFFWDVYMDWGLGRPKYDFLGPRLMYPRKGAYYAIIGLDLVLRFAWVLTLIPPDTGAKFALPHYLTVVSMVLELYRRTVWGFLRLENEHRSNTADRRVDFVPLHFSTGHKHEYKEEKEHRGFSVLLEVAIITCAVVAVSFGSVVAAQHATDRAAQVDL
mmetsp:Transcript_29503/g.81084  ORF Transcript_29503/g.81084 Transcript_29503/m.81084 type:complete len:913 (-) Transcript_29503:29-2767(-)